MLTELLDYCVLDVVLKNNKFKHLPFVLYHLGILYCIQYDFKTAHYYFQNLLLLIENEDAIVCIKYGILIGLRYEPKFGLKILEKLLNTLNRQTIKEVCYIKLAKAHFLENLQRYKDAFEIYKDIISSLEYSSDIQENKEECSIIEKCAYYMLGTLSS